MSIPFPKMVVRNGRRALSSISRRFYGFPSKKLKLIGITGTNGKTTTSFLLKSIYEKMNYKVGLIGTIAYFTGKRWKASERTTPESLDLVRTFRSMVDAGVRVAVVEVSSHALSLERVTGIKFNIAALTGIGRDHLDFYHTMRNYVNAKTRLFSALDKDSTAVLPRDDNYFELFKDSTGANIVTFGKNNNSDFMGSVSSSSLDGISVKIKWNNQRSEINSKLTGRHNLLNVLLSCAIAISDGIPLETVKRGIETLNYVPGRFEIIGNVIIDYAHTPDALKNALLSARELTKGKLICVFGCGGDRDRGKREEMGKIAQKLADYTIVTSDNPRFEEPMDIIRDIEKGCKKNYEIIEVRPQAIKSAMELAGKDDIILLAGKGHEEYQEIKGKKIPYDDREEVKRLLK
jgi:UDP-N-acetylmuramoyl-L-alanyl-D-glutamate--2,6-diaminopimelate ligase